MNRKWIALGASLVIGIVVVIVVSGKVREAMEHYFPPADAPKTEPVAETEGASDSDGTAQNQIESLNKVLPVVDPGINCKTPDAYKPVTDEDITFWSSPGTSDFIVYEPSSRHLTVCVNGTAIAGVLPRLLGDLDDNEEMVRVNGANLSDMNGDGKLEFLLYDAQCVEGPCIGSHYIVQVDGKQLKLLNALNAESVELLGAKGKQAFLMTNDCYTYEFGTAFSTLSVAEFQKDGALHLVPNQELAKRYPEAVDKLRISSDSNTPLDEAYGVVQELIRSAYQGKAGKVELFATLEKTLQGLPEQEGENDINDRLAVHCNARELLEAIAK